MVQKCSSLIDDAGGWVEGSKMEEKGQYILGEELEKTNPITVSQTEIAKLEDCSWTLNMGN